MDVVRRNSVYEESLTQPEIADLFLSLDSMRRCVPAACAGLGGAIVLMSVAQCRQIETSWKVVTFSELASNLRHDDRKPASKVSHFCREKNCRTQEQVDLCGGMKL